MEGSDFVVVGRKRSVVIPVAYIVSPMHERSAAALAFKQLLAGFGAQLRVQHEQADVPVQLFVPKQVRATFAIAVFAVGDLALVRETTPAATDTGFRRQEPCRLRKRHDRRCRDKVPGKVWFGYSCLVHVLLGMAIVVPDPE